MPKAIVFTLHGIEDPKKSLINSDDWNASKYIISKIFFLEIVRFLKIYHSNTVSELVSCPQKDSIALTFDDGLISDYKIAFPILVENEIKGTFYVNSINIGKKGYCSKSELREMISHGMDIGSHGQTHKYLTIMSKENAGKEIKDSKLILEDMLGEPVKSFAPVGGHYTKWMVEYAKEVGYDSFSSMIPGPNRLGKKSFIVKRNHIQKQHDIRYFQQNISQPNKIWVFNLVKYYALWASRKMLGIEKYDELKKIVLGK